MIKKNLVQKITNKEMDRKDFLKFGAMALVTVVGLKGVVSLITSPESHKASPVSQNQSKGYGSSAYGA
ncbi:hypothetical protein HGB25_00285 [Candidatus Saccharibacteria bacterium]|nr:hypothetical protein [Candidatus Saccharibacteria bacterium]